MKALIAIILFSLSFQAQAMMVDPNDMTGEQKTQLIKVLNQLEPEMLDTLLSEEALDWYIGQFSRTQASDLQDENNFETYHGRADIGYDAFADQNAPKFN